MCPSVNPVSFRLGSNSTLIWGRQPTPFFFSASVLKFNYVLLKFINYFFNKKNIQLVDFIINQASLRFTLMLVIYKVRLFARRYALESYKTFSTFRFRKDSNPVSTRQLRKKVVAAHSLLKPNYDLTYYGSSASRRRKFLGKKHSKFIEQCGLNRFKVKTRLRVEEPRVASNSALSCNFKSFKYKTLRFVAKENSFFSNNKSLSKKSYEVHGIINSHKHSKSLASFCFHKKTARRRAYLPGKKKLKLRIKNTCTFLRLKLNRRKQNKVTHPGGQLRITSYRKKLLLFKMLILSQHFNTAALSRVNAFLLAGTGVAVLTAGLNETNNRKPSVKESNRKNRSVPDATLHLSGHSAQSLGYHYAYGRGSFRRAIPLSFFGAKSKDNSALCFSRGGLSGSRLLLKGTTKEQKIRIPYSKFYMFKTSFGFLKRKMFLAKLLSFSKRDPKTTQAKWKPSLLSRGYNRASDFIRHKKKIKDFNWNTSIERQAVQSRAEKNTNVSYTYMKVRRSASARLQRLKELFVTRADTDRLLSIVDFRGIRESENLLQRAHAGAVINTSSYVKEYYHSFKYFSFFDIRRYSTLFSGVAGQTLVKKAKPFNYYNRGYRTVLLQNAFLGISASSSTTLQEPTNSPTSSTLDSNCEKKVSAPKHVPSHKKYSRAGSQRRRKSLLIKLTSLRFAQNKIFLPGVSSFLNSWGLVKKVGFRFKKKKKYIFNRTSVRSKRDLFLRRSLLAPGCAIRGEFTAGAAFTKLFLLANSTSGKRLSANLNTSRPAISFREPFKTSEFITNRGKDFFFFLKNTKLSLERSQKKISYKKAVKKLATAFSGERSTAPKTIVGILACAYKFWASHRYGSGYFTKQKKVWPPYVPKFFRSRWERKCSLSYAAARSRRFNFFLSKIFRIQFGKNYKKKKTAAVVSLKGDLMGFYHKFFVFKSLHKSFFNLIQPSPVKIKKKRSRVLQRLKFREKKVSASLGKKKTVFVEYAVNKGQTVRKQSKRFFKKYSNNLPPAVLSARSRVLGYLKKKSTILVPSAFKYWNSWVYKRMPGVPYEKTAYASLNRSYPEISKFVGRYRKSQRLSSALMKKNNKKEILSVGQKSIVPNFITNPFIKHKFKWVYIGSKYAKRFLLYSRVYKGVYTPGASASFRTRVRQAGYCALLKKTSTYPGRKSSLVATTTPLSLLSAQQAASKKLVTARRGFGTRRAAKSGKNATALVKRLFTLRSLVGNLGNFKTKSFNWPILKKQVRQGVDSRGDWFYASSGAAGGSGLCLLDPDTFSLSTAYFLEAERNAGTSILGSSIFSFLKVFSTMVLSSVGKRNKITKLSTRVIKKIRFFFRARTRSGKKKNKRTFENWKLSSLGWFLKKQEVVFLEFFFNHVFGVAFKISIFWAYNLLSYAEKIGLFLGKKSVFRQAHIPRRAQVFCKNFINLLRYSIKFYTLNSVSSYFSREFYSRPRQRIFLVTVEKILRYMNFVSLSFLGVSMLISGKLSRQPRAKKSFLMKGLRPSLNRFDLKINYVFRTVRCSFGSYGVKMWLYYW